MEYGQKNVSSKTLSMENPNDIKVINSLLLCYFIKRDLKISRKYCDYEYSL